MTATNRNSHAYVPETAARLEDDDRITDGARHCARKIAELTHRRCRESRALPITVSYLAKALRRSPRTVQRYLRQLEAAGYVSVLVVQTRARMCGGLLIAVMATLLPRHGWAKSMKPAMTRMSEINRDRFKGRYFPVAVWNFLCVTGKDRRRAATLPPLAA